MLRRIPFSRNLVSLFAVALLASTVAPQMIGLHRVSATGDGGYPWIGAATLSTTTGDFGYSTCPTSDSNCTLLTNATYPGYGEADPWVYNLRDCTSYAAWKINAQFNVSVSGWGNASTWDSHASPTYTVYPGSTHTPAVGEIAQWGTEKDGGLGHVAYVGAVNATTGVATLWEYNAALDGNFLDTRTTTTGVGFSNAGVPDHYIHIGTAGTSNQALLNTSNQVYSQTSIGHGWTYQASSNITKIAAGGNGTIMLLDTSGDVWAKDSSTVWTEEVTGGAVAIAAGAGGNQVILNSSNQVYSRTNVGTSGWTYQASGGITSIAAAGNGTIMLLDSSGDVWGKNNTTAWAEEVVGGTSAIAAGGDNTQLLLNTSNQLYSRTNVGTSGWTYQASTNITKIAAGGNGTIMLLDTSGDVWGKDNSTAWTEEVVGGMKGISAGSDGTQMILDTSSSDVWAKSSIGTSGWTDEAASGTVQIAAG